MADSETVKVYLSRLDWSLGTKEIASNVLENFYKFQGVPFSKPRYRRVDRIPFIPAEAEIYQLIGGCSRRVGPFLQFLISRFQESIEERNNIILAKLLEFFPDLPPKDPKRTFDYWQMLAIFYRDKGICQARPPKQGKMLRKKTVTLSAGPYRHNH